MLMIYFVILFPVLGHFNDISSITRVEVNSGETMQLNCDAPKSIPAPTFKWGLVREERESTSPQMLTLDKRVQIDQDGNYRKFE